MILAKPLLTFVNWRTHSISVKTREMAHEFGFREMKHASEARELAHNEFPIRDKTRED